MFLRQVKRKCNLSLMVLLLLLMFCCAKHCLPRCCFFSPVDFFFLFLGYLLCVLSLGQRRVEQACCVQPPSGAGAGNERALSRRRRGGVRREHGSVLFGVFVCTSRFRVFWKSCHTSGLEPIKFRPFIPFRVLLNWRCVFVLSQTFEGYRRGSSVF